MINEREAELWAERTGLYYELGRGCGEIATPVKTIRKHCLQCCGGGSKEVRECTAVQCWCWPYRLGKRPKR